MKKVIVIVFFLVIIFSINISAYENNVFLDMKAYIESEGLDSLGVVTYEYGSNGTYGAIIADVEVSYRIDNGITYANKNYIRYAVVYINNNAFAKYVSTQEYSKGDMVYTNAIEWFGTNIPSIPDGTNIINDAWLDYILVVPNQNIEYDSWNVKVSVKESSPMGDYWKYLDQYIFLGKSTWKFDKSSPIWQGRDKLYKFEITYIYNNEEVGNSVIEPSWNSLEKQTSLMPKFTIKNNDWKIQLASTYEADYRIVLNKVMVPSSLISTSVIPVNLVDDVFHLSDAFTTFYNMPESEVGFYYELYIMNADKSKLYAKFNWTRNDLKDWKKYEFTIDTPLKYDVITLVSKQYGSENYKDVTPDVVLDGNGKFIVSADPLGSAIDGLSSVKSSILGANTLMLSVVDMLVGYPLVATGVLMMSGVMVILVAVVIVKIFK